MSKLQLILLYEESELNALHFWLGAACDALRRRGDHRGVEVLYTLNTRLINAQGGFGPFKEGKQ